MLVCMIFLSISIGFDIFQKFSRKSWLCFGAESAWIEIKFRQFFIATTPILGVYCSYETRKTCKKTGADHLV